MFFFCFEVKPETNSDTFLLYLNKGTHLSQEDIEIFQANAFNIKNDLPNESARSEFEVFLG